MSEEKPGGGLPATDKQESPQERVAKLREKPEGKAMINEDGTLTAFAGWVKEVKNTIGGEIVGNIVQREETFGNDVERRRKQVDELWNEADVDDQIPQPDPEGSLAGRYIRDSVDLNESLGDEEAAFAERAINHSLEITQQRGPGISGVTHMGEVVMKDREGFLELTRDIAAAALTLRDRVRSTQEKIKPEGRFAAPLRVDMGAEQVLEGLSYSRFDNNALERFKRNAEMYPKGSQESAETLVMGLAADKWLRSRANEFADSVAPAESGFKVRLEEEAVGALKKSLSSLENSGSTFALARDNNRLAITTNGLIRNYLPEE